jgi:hypothetical protein
MLHTVICPGIEYAFYIVLFSISNIWKMDELLINLVTTVATSTPQHVTELFKVNDYLCTSFGIEAFLPTPKIYHYI